MISRKWCKIETELLWKTNRNLFMACQMARLPMTMSDTEGHFAVLSLCNTNNSGNIACFN